MLTKILIYLIIGWVIAWIVTYDMEERDDFISFYLFTMVTWPYPAILILIWLFTRKK